MANAEYSQLSFKISADSTSAASSVNDLANSLKNLKSAAGSSTSNLNKVANNLRSLKGTLNGFNSSKLQSVSNGLSAFSKIGKIQISSSLATNLQKLVNVCNSVDANSITNIKNLASALNSLGTSGESLSKIGSALPALQNTVGSVNNAASKTNGGLSQLGNTTRSATTGFRGLATALGSSAARFISTVFASQQLTNGITKCIQLSNEYQEDLNLFNVAMNGASYRIGDVTKQFKLLGLESENASVSAQDLAQKMSNLIGIDPAAWMRNQGVFNTIITGFGVATDKAQIMSEQLTQLGYDISSFYNISVDAAMQKLSSGISGELEPLRRLGYDLSVARLQQTAYNLGIQQSVQNMTQAEKSQLRYYAIMTQVTSAHGDMARSIETPANQLRILQAEVTQTARAIGNIFIPILNAVLPYLNAFFIALRQAADAIAKFFGFKLTKVDWSTQAKSAVSAAKSTSNLSNAVKTASASTKKATSTANKVSTATKKAGKSAESASKSYKKLQRQLQGFDKINNLTLSANAKSKSSSGTGSAKSPSSGAGVGGGGGVSVPGSGGDLGIDLPTYDFLDKYTKGKADKILGKLKTFLTTLMMIISPFLFALGVVLVMSGHIPLGIGLMVAGAVGIATAVGLTDTMTPKMKSWLAVLMGICGGAMVALGVILVMAGQLPFGIGLIAAGAFEIVASVKLNTGSGKNKVKAVLQAISGIAGGFLLALGCLLILTGAGIPIGIACIAAGIVGIVSAAGMDPNGLPKKVKKVMGIIASIASLALLALGCVLLLTVVGIPVGIACIIAGIGARFAARKLNGDAELVKLVNKLISKLSKFGSKIFKTALGLGKKIVKGVVSGIKGIGGKIKDKFSSAWKSVKTIWNESKVGKTFKKVTGKIGKVFGMMKKPTAKQFGVAWDVAKKAFSKTKVGKFFAGLVGSDKDSDSSGSIMGAFSKLKDGKKGLQAVMSTAWEAAKGVFSGKSLTESITDALNYANKNIPGAKVVLEVVGDKLQEWKDKWDDFKDGTATKVLDVKKGFWNGVDDFKNLVGSTVSKILTTVKGKWDGFVQFVGIAGGVVKKTLKTALTGVKTRTLKAYRKVWESIKNKRKTLKTKLSGVKEKALISLRKAWNAIKTKSALLTARYWADFSNKALTKVANAWGAIRSKTVKLAVSFKENIGKGWNWIVSHIFGKAMGGILRGNGWHPIQQYAAGGLPPSGQLFVAREAGPEMVGRIGGHTAVMNNDQIVASVSAGVANANAEQNALLRQMISALYRMMNQSNGDIVLKVNETELGRASARGINKAQRQSGSIILEI